MPRPVPTEAVLPPRPTSSAPARVQPHSSLASAFTGAPMYCLVVGDKISTKWKRQRRAVVLTSLFTLFCDLNGGVRRLVELSQVDEVMLVAGQGKAEAPYVLVRFLDKAEPDFLFQWRTDPRNTVPAPAAFIDILCKLARARPPHREVPVTSDAQLPLNLVARLFHNPERPKARLGRYASRAAEEARAADFQEAREVELEEARKAEVQKQAELAWVAGRGPVEYEEGDISVKVRPEAAHGVISGHAHLGEQDELQDDGVRAEVVHTGMARAECADEKVCQVRAASEASAQTSSSVDTGSSGTGEGGAVTVRAFFAGLNSAVEQVEQHTAPIRAAPPAAPPIQDDEPVAADPVPPSSGLAKAEAACPPLPLRDTTAPPPAPPSRPALRTTQQSLRPPPPKRTLDGRRPPPAALDYSPAQGKSSPSSDKGDDLFLPPPPPEPAAQLRRANTVGSVKVAAATQAAAPPHDEKAATVRLLPPPVGRRPSTKATHTDALGDIAQLLGGDAPVVRTGTSTTPQQTRRLNERRGLATYVARPVVDSTAGASPVAVTAISARRTSPGAGTNPVRRLNFGGSATIPSFEQFGGTPEQHQEQRSPGKLQEVMMRRL